jgi:hypothetical protein
MFGDISYLVPFDREETQMRFNLGLLFSYVMLCYVTLHYIILCVLFYFHELSALIVSYFTIFTESYLYFTIRYLDL